MKLVNSIRLPLIIIAIFWLVEFIEVILGLDFHYLGTLPRSSKGVIGIFLSPFLHGGFSHLLSNSSSFFILCGSVIYFYPRISLKIITQTYIFTGIGVWLFARGSYLENGISHDTYHIGASGLVYAYAAFLFCSGLFRKDTKSLVLSLAVALLYNGMLYGLVPNQPGISWESHLIGAIVGAFFAYRYRKVESGTEEVIHNERFYIPDEGYQNIENQYMKYEYKENKSLEE
ncbi:MAG: rhomboid family intramembrane serine protease [Flammeovirgaceae bacterium]